MLKTRLFRFVFLVSFFSPLSPQSSQAIDLKEQIAALSVQIQEIQRSLQPKEAVFDVAVPKTNYFLLFRSAINIGQRLLFADFNALFSQNILKLINMIKSFEICIQAFCLLCLCAMILMIPLDTFMFIPSRIASYPYISFLVNLINKNAISIFFAILAFAPNVAVNFVSKIIDFFPSREVENLAPIVELILNVSFITFIRYFIVDLINQFDHKIHSLKSLKGFFDAILVLKIIKILAIFFISFFLFEDLSLIKRDINNLDLLCIFLIFGVMLFKIRTIFLKNSIRSDILIKQLLIPLVSIFFVYYIFEKHDSVFLYKSIATFFVWPIIYRLYLFANYFGYSYLKTLTKIQRKSNRDLIRIFLIMRNTVSYFTVPIAIIVTLYIFRINVIHDLKMLFGYKLCLRVIATFLLLFITRIFFIFSRYLSIYYSEINSLNKDQQRIKTVSIFIRYIFVTFLFLVTTIALMFIFDYDIAPIFQMMSYVFIALTITAQKLVRDVINGIFMLSENTIKVNDWIEYNGRTAIVEDMSLRYMRVRFDDGLLVTIPFHKIDVIKNKTRQNSFIVFNISFSIDTDVDLAETAVLEAFNNLKNKDEFNHRIVRIETRDMADMTAFSYVLQYRICVEPKWQNKVRRAFNKEMRIVFLKYGVSIAMPLVANINSVPSLTTGMPYPDSP